MAFSVGTAVLSCIYYTYLYLPLSQFEGVGWVPRDATPGGQVGGYVKMGGQVGGALLGHPQGDLWSTPAPVVERLRRTNPLEYFNLCDPLNKIP